MKKESKTAGFSVKNAMGIFLSGKTSTFNDLFFGPKLMIGLLFYFAIITYSSGCDDGITSQPEMPNIPITIKLINAHSESTNLWIEMDGVWEVKTAGNLVAPGTSRTISGQTVFPDAQNDIAIWGFVDGYTQVYSYSVLTDKYNKLKNVHIFLTATFDGTNFSSEETYTSD